MDGHDYHLIGMHFFWWGFWLVLLTSFFLVATPVRRTTARLFRESPFAILKRRYAAGEITAEEYEERRARIERDSPGFKLRLASPVPPDPAQRFDDAEYRTQV